MSSAQVYVRVVLGSFDMHLEVSKPFLGRRALFSVLPWARWWASVQKGTREEG